MDARDWLRDTPGEILSIFRREAAGLTTSDAVRLTGLSRTAASQRIDLLREAGYLAIAPASAGRVGRPGTIHAFAKDRGYILAADTGATGMRLALSDAAGTVVAETYRRFVPNSGPADILRAILAAFRHVLQARKLDKQQVLGIGVSVPGPVDQITGRVVRPPSMAGWHNFDIQGPLAAEFDCPVLVETDANAMAFGESRICLPQVENLAFLKLGTGISVGLIVAGAIYRGANGSAGEIGHTQTHTQVVTGPPGCRCGNSGCLEAYAGGWALVRDLRELGLAVESVDDVVAASREGNHDAVRLVRAAALMIGTAVGDLVNLFNPGKIVVGGQLSALDEIVLAAIRERVYQRALPIATRDLEVLPAGLVDPGVHGLSLLVSNAVHDAATVDDFLRSRS